MSVAVYSFVPNTSTTFPINPIEGYAAAACIITVLGRNRSGTIILPDTLEYSAGIATTASAFSRVASCLADGTVNSRATFIIPLEYAGETVELDFVALGQKVTVALTGHAYQLIGVGVRSDSTLTAAATSFLADGADPLRSGSALLLNVTEDTIGEHENSGVTVDSSITWPDASTSTVNASGTSASYYDNPDEFAELRSDPPSLNLGARTALVLLPFRFGFDGASSSFASGNLEMRPASVLIVLVYPRATSAGAAVATYDGRPIYTPSATASTYQPGYMTRDYFRPWLDEG